MNNSLGSFEVITYDYVVAGIKMALGIKDTTEDDLFFMDSVNRGVKRLRNLGTFVPAVTTLQISKPSFTAKLPIGFIKFNHSFPICFVDATGTALVNGSPTVPLYINNTYYTDSPVNASNQIRSGTVNVVNGYLYFSSNTTADYCKIEYLTANMDNNGEILIPAIAEDALIAFGAAEWCLKEQDLNRYGIFNRTWKKGKKALKGINNGSQGYDQPYITYKQKSLI